MKLLALDAALGPFSVALDLDGMLTSEVSDRNDALENGLGRIAGLLERAGAHLGVLDRIAVGIGPGSFTGIRIALSFAKALAYAADLPLVGISSYDVLTPANAAEPYVAIVAGRPGVLCARMRSGGIQTTACGPAVSVVQQLRAGWPPDVPFTVYAAHKDVFSDLGEGPGTVEHIVAAAAVPAAVVAVLARDREPSPSPHSVAPDYGEMPAVTVPKAGTESLPERRNRKRNDP